MAKLPPALVESLRLRQVVIVAGARCSELGGLLAWPALADVLNEWIEEPDRREEVRALLEGGRALAALARLRDILPDDLVGEVIIDAVKGDPPIPAALAAVAKIPWRLLVSTAPDDLWERAATADPAQPTSVVLPGQDYQLDHPGRALMPLFGR